MLGKDMNYGMNGVYENVHGTTLNTSASYHPFSSHRHLRSTLHPRDSSPSWKVTNHQHHEDREDEDENTEVERDFSAPASADDDDDELNDSDRPKLLMWGLSKGGKTSIIKLIFEKMNAGETLKLPETKMIQLYELNCGIHVRFQIRDVPGPKTSSLCDFSAHASESTTVIFILDVTEDYSDSIRLLVSSVQWMYAHGHRVRFEVLLHKIDGLHENERQEQSVAIQQQVRAMLHECSVEGPLLNFYLTSIYDHSIHEAFSKIIQNQIRQLRALENMLDLVTTSTQLDKIFVCDIYNKIFLASDTKPIESQLAELCCDVVDVYTDISSIYGSNGSPALDSMSFCTIELSKGVVLYLKDINPTTALICIYKKESKINEALMDVNLNILKKNIQDLFRTEGKNPSERSSNE